MIVRFPQVDHTAHASSSPTAVEGAAFFVSGTVVGPSDSVLGLSIMASPAAAVCQCLAPSVATMNSVLHSPAQVCCISCAVAIERGG